MPHVALFPPLWKKTTNSKGQVVDVSDKLTSLLGFGINEPWVEYLSNTKFYRANSIIIFFYPLSLSALRI
jgi:hypothetical protein